MSLTPPSKAGLRPVQPPPVRVVQYRHSPVRVEVLWPAGCAVTCSAGVAEQLVASGHFRPVGAADVGDGAADRLEVDDTPESSDKQPPTEPEPKPKRGAGGRQRLADPR